MCTATSGRAAFAWATGGVLLAAAFTVWALTASIYSSGATLLEQNAETVVRVAVATPLVGAVVIWTLLHAACRRGSPALQKAGFVLACVLTVLSVLASMTVGMFALPAALTMLWAATITPADRTPASA